MNSGGRYFRRGGSSILHVSLLSQREKKGAKEKRPWREFGIGVGLYLILIKSFILPTSFCPGSHTFSLRKLICLFDLYYRVLRLLSSTALNTPKTGYGRDESRVSF